MKRLALVFASFAIALSCTANPPIVPEPNDATTGTGGFGGDGGAGGNSSSSAASSGSSSGTPLPGDGSGTRLKRYVHASADGLLSIHGLFYDATLQFDCTSAITPNGRRCIPYTPVPTVTVYFRDALCTDSVVLVSTGCPPPKYVTVYGVGVCSTGMTKSVVVGAPLPHAAYYKNGASCFPCTASQIDAYDVYEHLGEADYTQFASMTLEHE